MASPNSAAGAPGGDPAHPPADSASTSAPRTTDVTLLRTLRRAGRAVWLTAELARAGLLYLLMVAFRGGVRKRDARLRWFRRSCLGTLRVLAAEVQSRGPVPRAGFLVANHLSYLDILALGTVAPGVYVAKSEVRRWPVFGWFAILMGTVFVQRERRFDVDRIMAAMERKLGEGLLVILFPEGTSSDGHAVLPFKPSLLEPAARGVHPVSAAHIGYTLHDLGDVGEDVCYWRDMSFGPHLWNLLGKRRLTVSIAFRAVEGPARDRKELARQLHAAVVRLGEGRQARSLPDSIENGRDL
jgi:lyso-ornithine lipid O-acyltransferase